MHSGMEGDPITAAVATGVLADKDLVAMDAM